MYKNLFIVLVLLGITVGSSAQNVNLKKGTEVFLESVSDITMGEFTAQKMVRFVVTKPVIINGVIVIPKESEIIANAKVKTNSGGYECEFASPYIRMSNGDKIFLKDIKVKKEKDKSKSQVSLLRPFKSIYTIVKEKKSPNSSNSNNDTNSSTILAAKGEEFITSIEKDISITPVTDFALSSQDKPQQTSTIQLQQNKETTVVAEKTTPSDVDINIPKTSKTNENAFAIIIANEKYQSEVEVKYAMNDGQTFKMYCEQTLGIPAEHIHYRENATLNNIIAEVDWLQKVCSVFDGDARVIFYYAGHGIPDESSKDAYLLPVDGVGSNVSTGYKLSNLYEVLGKMNTNNVSVFLDACFSGSQRDKGMLASARGVAIKAKPQAPVGSMVVLSAAQGDETAYPYKEKGHGLFTYFLLKKIQQSKGDCTMQELADYVKTQVARHSIVVNGKPQTPAVSHSTTLGENWKGLTLK